MVVIVYSVSQVISEKKTNVIKLDGFKINPINVNQKNNVKKFNKLAINLFYFYNSTTSFLFTVTWFSKKLKNTSWNPSLG